MWHIRYADSIIREDIPRLDHAVKQRVRKIIETKLATDPVCFGEPLRHSLHHLRSFRVGDYRTLYHIEQATLTVSIVSIGHRRDVYEA